MYVFTVDPRTTCIANGPDHDDRAVDRDVEGALPNGRDGECNVSYGVEGSVVQTRR